MNPFYSHPKTSRRVFPSSQRAKPNLLLTFAAGALACMAGATGAETLEVQRATVSAQSESDEPVRGRLRAQAARRVIDVSELQEDVPIAIPERALRTRTRRMAMTAAPLYALPFKGEDINPGERIYRGKQIHSSSGSQQWGYDLGAIRLVGGSWRQTKSSYDSSNPKNSDYHINGKPVYAMGDGTIIRCWRNAPDNPRPFSSAMGDDFDQPFEDREWLHQAWRDKKMSGAGNHILVEEDNGDLVLYAHFKPGSLPASLCPHNQTLFSTPDATEEADVPPAQQVEIKKGQKIALVGNSGNSSAPHLHVHKQDPDNNPVQLKFERGLSTPYNGSNTDINAWTSFRGEMIPPGKVLIWPPLSLGAEYARHGMPAGTYQRMFNWLAESGYWLEWIDTYSVSGNSFINHVWRPANGAWRAYHLLTPQAYQARFDEATSDGYRPVQVESSLSGGQVRYSAIFVKNKPGGYLARHGLTYDQHMAVMDEAKSKNLYPVNISVVSVGGQRRYTVLYRSENIGQWRVKSQIPAADYQALYNQNAQAGRRPSYVNAYMHNGSSFFTVIFSQNPAGQRKDRHGMTPSQYQSEFDSAHQGGLLTRGVSGYDGAASNHRYIAFWRK